jgi:hypothetical protein
MLRRALTGAKAITSRLEAQAREISVALSDAGCSAMPIPQAVRQLIEERDEARGAARALNWPGRDRHEAPSTSATAPAERATGGEPIWP